MISFRGLTKSMRGRDGFERYSRPDDAVLIANFAMALTTNFIEKERCAAASSLRNSLRHAGNHMLLLGRGTAMQRVANFLLEMDRRLAHRGMMALPMCRRDYLGLALETASVAAQSSMHFSEGLKTWSPLQFCLLLLSSLEGVAHSLRNRRT